MADLAMVLDRVDKIGDAIRGQASESERLGSKVERVSTIDAAGMNAIATDSVLDRCWRAVHAMTQHLILSPARYEIAGRVLLGLEPGAPVI
jgi:hypothetical protein